MAHIKRSQIRQLIREMVRSVLAEETTYDGTVPEWLVAELTDDGSWMHKKRLRQARPYWSNQHSFSFSWTPAPRVRDGKVTSIESSEWDERRFPPSGQDRAWNGRKREGKATVPSGAMADLAREIKQAIIDFKSYERQDLPAGRYVITYPVSPTKYPDDDDPYRGGIGQPPDED